MSPAISDLTALLRTMEPELHDGAYAYCVVPPGTDLSALSPVATVAEAEGLTVILPEAQAIAAGFSVLFRAAWITLTVHSDLQAVGLTAAFATALGQAGISCNVIAGAFHDHIFVPVGQGPAALVVALHLLAHRRTLRRAKRGQQSYG
ncbi:MAG: ACT domain-containing protein [Proteobacteria bacterium]|nr:ACT domain-containing protein [Pseudomonadota bacterium]